MIIFVAVGGLYCWFYFENVHFHVTHAYAHLGYDVAQHQVGQRYLHGEKEQKVSLYFLNLFITICHEFPVFQFET